MRSFNDLEKKIKDIDDTIAAEQRARDILKKPEEKKDQEEKDNKETEDRKKERLRTTSVALYLRKEHQI